MTEISGAYKICVAVDDTKASVKALEYALSDVANRKEGCEVHLLHIVKVPLMHHSEMTSCGNGAATFDKNTMVKMGQKMLETDFVPLLKNAGVTYFLHVVPTKDTTMEVLSKTVGKHICMFAADEKVDMLVMAKHTGAVKSALIGSVTKYVTEHTEVPLVVRP